MGGIAFYISPNYPLRGEIQDELINSGYATKDNILNYEDCTKYLSCVHLEQEMVLSVGQLYHCCRAPGRNQIEGAPYHENIQETIDEFIKQRDETITCLREGKVSPCDGCQSLTMGYWRDKKFIQNLDIGLSYPCQLSCCYCTWPCNAKNIAAYDKKSLVDVQNLDVSQIIKLVEDNGVFPTEGFVNIASGEITIAENCDKILDACGNHPVAVLTNALIYNERIARLTARDNGSYLNVSVDSGTAETYAAVKGLDAYEKVKRNLFHYRDKGSRVTLKYIVMNQNNNSRDMTSFVNLVEQLGIERVDICYDFNLTQDGVMQDILDGAVFLMSELKKKNVLCGLSQAFAKEHVDYIKRYFEFRC